MAQLRSLHLFSLLWVRLYFLIGESILPCPPVQLWNFWVFMRVVSELLSNRASGFPKFAFTQFPSFLRLSPHSQPSYPIPLGAFNRTHWNTIKYPWRFLNCVLREFWSTCQQDPRRLHWLAVVIIWSALFNLSSHWIESLDRQRITFLSKQLNISRFPSRKGSLTFRWETQLSW